MLFRSIYQIRDGLPGENYAFMNMSFIESHGMQIKKEDYELVYVGDLFGNMSLDDIFELFNIDKMCIRDRCTREYPGRSECS